jgi:hypothetical protein
MTFELNPVPMMLKSLSVPSDMQVNESFLRMIGYQRTDVADVQSVLSGIYPSDSQRASFDEKISRQGSFREYPILIQTAPARSWKPSYPRRRFEPRMTALPFFFSMT